jgi:hypothetical protein
MEDHILRDKITVLTDLVLEFYERLGEYKIPEELVLNIADIINGVTDICAEFLIQNKNQELAISDFKQTNDELAGYINQLLEKNIELEKFVEAAKKFPGFQC